MAAAAVLLIAALALCARTGTRKDISAARPYPPELAQTALSEPSSTSKPLERVAHVVNLVASHRALPQRPSVSPADVLEIDAAVNPPIVSRLAAADAAFASRLAAADAEEGDGSAPAGAACPEVKFGKDVILKAQTWGTQFTADVTSEGKRVGKIRAQLGDFEQHMRFYTANNKLVATAHKPIFTWGVDQTTVEDWYSMYQ